MRFLKLRIVWSVTCGTLCLLLIALWVRSYRDLDLIELGILAWPMDGNLIIYDPFPRPERIEEGQIYFGDGSTRLPMWILVCEVTAVAAIPWIRWRFSLRTLLIVTALAAVLMWMIAWEMR